MGQIRHKRATTTHEIRNKIRQEQGTTNAIARKFNIDWTTAKKWKNRNSIEYQPMGNGLQFSYRALSKALKNQ